MKKYSFTYGISVNVLFSISVLAGLYIASLYNFLLFHVLVELFSIVTAFGIFMLVWNSREFTDNHYLLFLGTAYLFIAGLDLVHTLAYKGMNIFPGYDANLPTQIWIASRYLESISFVIAGLLLKRRFRRFRTGFVLSAYAAVFLILLITCFRRIFPDCFIEGTGLTRFKITSEYVISMILLAAFIMLFCQHRRFEPYVARLMFVSVFLTILSELSFTFYISVYGFSNMIGHFFKLISFYLIYKAIIETGFSKPYNLLFRELKLNEAYLHKARETAEAANQVKSEVLANLQKEIASRKCAEQDALKRAKELERSNRDLEQFAYVVSHDLQEPLRMVSSYVQLLERRYKGKLDSDADEFISFAVDGAARMHTLLSDMLALSRVGTRGKPFGPVETGQILEETLANLSVSIRESRAVVTHDLLPRVTADASQLTQVFQNLISNAIRFRSPDLPRIHITAENMGREWVFSFQDNGIGIAPEYYDRIFVVFQRLHTRDKYPGTGIGLAICKKIIERHSGRLWVESREGVGSVFYFTLPAD